MNDNDAKPRVGKENVVLVLQGGGALGSYQAGVLEEIVTAGHCPSWICGISIGAINAALIAGNPPETAIERMREFWHQVTKSVTLAPFIEEAVETAFNQTAAATTLMFGVPGFFTPRLPPPFAQPPGTLGALSYYDTAELRRTLERLVDFDRINSRPAGRTRLSVGAVAIASGNFTYFDNDKMRIGPEHIMASGALPPGLPPVLARDADGREDYYWDGGLVSNTPLQYVLDEDGRDDLLVFQVDLFSARGALPSSLLQVAERVKDIRFSSRTRFNSDVMRLKIGVAAAAERLEAKAGGALAGDADLAFLKSLACVRAATLVQFIYKSKHSSGYVKDYEFSRASMLAHWAAGREDVRSSLAHPAWQSRGAPQRGEIRVLDLADPVAAAAASAEASETVRQGKP